MIVRFGHKSRLKLTRILPIPRVRMGALIYKALQRHISSRSSAAEWNELLTRVLAALPAGTRPDWANGIGLPELLRFAAEYLDTTPDQLLFDAAAAWVGPADAPPRSDTTAASST